MTDLAADNAKKISRWNSVSPHLAIKRYRKDGGLKSLDEILEEYRQARRKKRDQMWFLYIDLRKEFDDIERDSDKDLTGKCPVPPKRDWRGQGAQSE
jgi:hypothetical protein